MPLTAAHGALERTGLLLADDIHHGRAASHDVIDGLLATTVSLRATADDVGSLAAQHAVVTLALHLAMCGIGINLDFPDVPLLAAQPPLGVDGGLRSSVDTHLRETFPWVRLGPVDRYDATFTIGSSAPREPGEIVVTGTANRIIVGAAAEVAPNPWTRSSPLTAIAAGIAAAAHAVRIASTVTARTLNLPAPLVPRGPTVLALDLPPSGFVDLGEIPTVSAGAITNNALFALLRVADLAGRLRLFDDDQFDHPNYNRYPLLIASQLGEGKALATTRWSTDTLLIEPIPTRYFGGEAAGADRILVGADDIAIRWRAQDDTGRWLGVGATSHLFAQVSTHVPGSPCSGCVHPDDDDAIDVIPTISVVSGWVGLHLAIELLRDATRRGNPRVVSSFPLALNGSHAHAEHVPRPASRCPRGCEASRQTA
jgi:hypothetical protein